MKQITRSIEIHASAPDAWKLIGDIDGYRSFMVGITKWERVEGQQGNYWILMRVGSIATGGEVTVDVDEAARELSWSSVRGTEHTARLTVVETGPGRCRLDLDFTYRLTGPVAGLVEATAAPIVRRNLIATLETARHIIEHDDAFL